MQSVKIRLSWLEEADRNVPLPAYESKGAAGADVRANFAQQDRGGIELAPGARALVPTGIRLEIPPGYVIQMRP